MDESHHHFEISEAIQQEVIKGLIEFIKHERRRRSLWNKIKTYFSRIKHLKCICGPAGCECDIEPHPPILPSQVKISRRECTTVGEEQGLQHQPDINNPTPSEGSPRLHTRTSVVSL